jgi:hypothetical protein
VGAARQDGQLVPQREVLEHQGAAGSEHAEEACEDEGDHAGLIDQSGRQFNVDETDGVSRRHRFSAGSSAIDLHLLPRSNHGVSVDSTRRGAGYLGQGAVAQGRTAVEERGLGTLKVELEARRTRSLAAVDVFGLYLDMVALRVRSAG